MTKRQEIYKCDACGQIVEVLHVGDGALVCCGKPMRLLYENATDASKEKHVPVIERQAGGVKVTIGSVPHPMEEKHYIEWIELQADGKSHRQFLKPGNAPSALFEGISGGVLFAHEYCNLHGLWKA